MHEARYGPSALGSAPPAPGGDTGAPPAGPAQKTPGAGPILAALLSVALLTALLLLVERRFGPAVAGASLAGLLLCAALLLSWRRAQALRAELERLRQGLARVAAGDLDCQLELRRDDPLGALFNDMVRQRRQSEAALRASTALASSIVATAYDAYVAIDEAGRVIDWNHQAERVFGWSREEALGQAMVELIIPPRYRDAHRQGLQRYLQTGAARVLNQRLELSALRRDGVEFPVELTIWAIEAGEQRQFSAFLHDISDRQRMTQTLERDREFLNAILENLADGIVACDERGVLTVFNRATREFHGLPEEPLPPERWAEHYDLYEADGRTRLPTARIPLFRALRGETIRDVEIVISPTDRPPRTVLCSGRPLVTPAGRQLGAVVAMHDITERKRAETQLAARAAELARSNWELERFAYIASHDLQEPLRTVASYAQLLARRHRHTGGPDEEFTHYITDAAHRMRDLIDGLLAYSRITHQEVPPEPADLGRLVERAIANLKDAIDRSGAQIHCEPLPTLSVNVAQFVQLFQNLIGNALKFRSAAPPQVQIRAQRGEGQWLIAVRDNGIGIDPAHAERIFTLFQRLHTSDAYPGSGIGLAICKRIVERHGGRIWVEPAESGAEFRFTLPAAS